MKAYRLFILVSMFLLSTPPVSVAQETPEKPFLAKPFMKFVRGAVNMISAPLEVPNQVYLLSDYATENSPYGIETASAAIEGLFTGIDQSGLTVDDGCARQGGVQCVACGYDEDRVRSVLDSILPSKWCGEATP